MYYYISGELSVLEPNTAVIDAGGVGYQLTISGTTCGKLGGKLGEKVKLFTHLAVREDALELFGFYSNDELKTFRMLLTVSGIGAKSAIAILTQLSPERLASAIAMDDAKSIASAPGIGAKTAARIVLELKDKLAKEISASSVGSIDVPSSSAVGSNYSEAVNALLVLGYTKAEAQYALKDANPSLDTETLIRTALSKLMKG